LSNTTSISVKGKTTNRYELIVALEEKMYLETYYQPTKECQIYETLAKVKSQELKIVNWMLTKK
jgi:hypothetical protein